MNVTQLTASPLASIFNSTPSDPKSLAELISLLGSSVILGAILTALTLAVSLPILNAAVLGVSKEKINKKKFEQIVASMNILFICVGLTSIMILVNNNLARALAIGATLGLIRFRINLNSKLQGSNMLFGIIAGISCGLGEVALGWLVTGVYVVLQGTFYITMMRFNQKFVQDLLLQNGQETLELENKESAEEEQERGPNNHQKSFENVPSMPQ
jgi:hypothetical protein